MEPTKFVDPKLDTQQYLEKHQLHELLEVKACVDQQHVPNSRICYAGLALFMGCSVTRLLLPPQERSLQGQVLELHS